MPDVVQKSAVQFSSHIDLLRFFLTRRDEIVERIQRLLNAQRRPIEQLRDRPLLSHHFDDCFFSLSGVTHSQVPLRTQLDEAHWAGGFKPRALPGLYNGLADPAEMMTRAFHLWQQTRWPGRNGRIRYAHTLFHLSVIRRLELLSLRLWDDGADNAGGRLADLQGVLDRLWSDAPPDQPVLVRDARWLIQLAQSPATDDLGAYFEMTAQIAGSLSPHDRVAIHRAGVCMTAGHLRSQSRYYSLKQGVPLADGSVTRLTRNTNALDFALLVQELVPLLDAYDAAGQRGDDVTRLALADVICQGLSTDPDLFVNRIHLLGAYSTIEQLAVTTDSEGRAAYTALGQRHAGLLRDYGVAIDRVATRLFEDCQRFRPVSGACSPYGVLYGFSSNLIEHMAFKTLQTDSTTSFSLEDVFTSGDSDGGKLAWVDGWRKLPHLTPDVRAAFDYPQQFAEDVFTRLEDALSTRVSNDGAARGAAGRLFLVSENATVDKNALMVPALALDYIGSSDPQLVAAAKATLCDESQILSDRGEGRSLVSYQTPGGWVAITKSVLTEVLGAGHDAAIAGLPPAVAQSLALVCPNLVVAPPPTA